MPSIQSEVPERHRSLGGLDGGVTSVQGALLVVEGVYLSWKGNKIMGEENKERIDSPPQTDRLVDTPVIGDERVEWHGQASKST